jgi:hypothetical protein
MLVVLGIAVLLAGLLVLVWGDKEIPVRGGIILKLFSAPKRYVRWYKVVMGLGLCTVELKF